MNASDVYVKEVNSGEWGVLGANLPANTCWAIFETQDEAIAEAEKIARAFGVNYVGVRS